MEDINIVHYIMDYIMIVVLIQAERIGWAQLDSQSMFYYYHTRMFRIFKLQTRYDKTGLRGFRYL